MSTKDLRVNEKIKITPVRLIGPNGEQLGIIPINEALMRAHEYELDLVEVSPTSRPPVCRILDFGKYKYELSKKDKLAKKKQHSYQLKEMRYRPKIDEHDFNFKTNHVRSFLEAGSKVKAYVMFRGREMAYTEQGRTVLDRVAEVTQDIATIEIPAKMEGRNMNMVLAPRPELIKKLKNTAPEKEKAEKEPRKTREISEKTGKEEVTASIDENK